MPIQMQIQARHVDAARIRTIQIHERGHARAEALRVAVGLREQHRRLDVVHADPVEPSSQSRQCFSGDIGHRAQRIFSCSHTISLRDAGRKRPRSLLSAAFAAAPQ
jgi:hypothetical protein